MKHDLDRFGLFFVKNVLQNLHDKFFRRVIVVMQLDLIKRRAFDLLFGLGDQPVFMFGFPAAHGRLASPET
jgi:hypothetical protein